MYSRYLRERIEKRLGSGKAIVVIGPRQVGKTTLIESILASKDYLLLDGDDPKTRTILAGPNTDQIRAILGKYKFLIYAAVIGGTIFSAITLRNFTISKMSTAYGKDYMAVSVSYISPQVTKKTIDIMLEDSNVQYEINKIFKVGEAKMFYVMPQSWVFPELGMVAEFDNHNDPEQRTVSHGNSEDTKPMLKRVLISRAILIQNVESSVILKYMKQQIPKLYVDIDIEKGKVLRISKPPVEGIYSDIPVPMF